MARVWENAGVTRELGRVSEHDAPRHRLPLAQQSAGGVVGPAAEEAARVTARHLLAENVPARAAFSRSGRQCHATGTLGVLQSESHASRPSP